VQGRAKDLLLCGLPLPVVNTLMAESQYTTNSPSLSLFFLFPEFRVRTAHNTRAFAHRDSIGCLVTAVCQKMRSLSAAAKANSPALAANHTQSTHFCSLLCYLPFLLDFDVAN